MAPFHNIYIFYSKVSDSFFFNNNNIVAIKCQLTHDLMVHGWNFPYCNFPPRLSYTTRFAIFHQQCSTRSATFHKERKWESFFFFFLDNAAFMCKHLYHCSFLVLLLSLKKKKSEYSLLQIFFFPFAKFFIVS